MLTSIFVWSQALGHGPAPAALGVIAPGNAVSAPPALVRMNIGLARLESPNTYTYLCPSQWGDVEQPRAAASGEGQTLVVLGGGRAFLSVDGGCSFVDAALPVDQGRARDVLWGGSRVHVLVSGDEGGALYRLEEATTWKSEGVFQPTKPDTFALNGQGDSLWVGVAGARPSPAIWLGSTTDLEDAGLQWVQINPLPPLEAPQNLSVRAVEEGGAIWLVSTHEDGLRLWRGEPSEDDKAQWAWASLSGVFARIMGPVRVDSGRVVVADGRVLLFSDARDGDTLTAVEGAEVDWTCLQEIQGSLFACTLPTLFALSSSMDISQPEAALAPVYAMPMLRAPETGCLDTDAADLCFGDWVHFGAEAGLLDHNPVSDGGCRAISGGSRTDERSFFWLCLTILCLTLRPFRDVRARLESRSL